MVLCFYLGSDCINSRQDEPLKQWTPLRDEYLAELLRLEGRGEFTSEKCPSCVHDPFDDFSTSSKPNLRCQDCFTGELVCEECCVRLHLQHPLHIIDVRVNYFIRLHLDFLTSIY
jgi:hypothetical protein